MVTSLRSSPSGFGGIRAGLIARAISSSMTTCDGFWGKRTTRIDTLVATLMMFANKWIFVPFSMFLKCCARVPNSIPSRGMTLEMSSKVGTGSTVSI